MMFTDDKITGREAAEMGLVLEKVPDDQLDAEIEWLAARIATVPINQLAMQERNEGTIDWTRNRPIDRLTGIHDVYPGLASRDQWFGSAIHAS